MPKVTWLVWCRNNRSGDIATTFPERSSFVATGKDSDARGRRYLGISVILVTMSLLLVWKFWGDAKVAVVATVVVVPLTALSALAVRHETKSDGDSGDGQPIAGITTLIGAVVLFAVVVTLTIQRSGEDRGDDDTIPTPTATPTPTPSRSKTPKPTPTPSPTPVMEPSTPPTSKAPPPPPPPTPRWVKAWNGPFRLQHLSGIDLDTTPPSFATGPADNLDQGDLFYDNRDALSPKLVPQAWVAIPESNTRPDANACDKALGTLRNNDPIDPKPGQYLCLGTALGRLARLEVTDVQQYDYVRFNVIVWKWRD